MARDIPKARDSSLEQHAAKGTALDPITIGTAAWYNSDRGATIGMRTGAAMVSCIPPTSVSQKN